MNENKAKAIIEEEINNLDDREDMQPQDWVNFIIQLIKDNPFMCIGLCVGCFIDVLYRDHKEKKEIKKSIPDTKLKVLNGGK